MKKNTLLIAGLLIVSLIRANTNDWVNICKMGASPKGETIATNIIQKAIDDCEKQGGGVIYFPAGDYLTGALHLKSNITLHLDAGATLRFSDNPKDYLPFIKVRWEGIVMNSFRPLIHAENAENICIEGRGTLDGQGQKWWDIAIKKKSEIKENGDISEVGEYENMWDAANPDIEVSDYFQKTLKRKFFRPPFFQTYKCNNIRIVGVKFINSPFWTINPAFCDHITIDGITINNPISPNTDGINPSSCSNMRIANCHISVGDDCITIKSGRDAQGRDYGVPCQNITITNCTMLNGHGGVVIGSEASGSVRKITISNCIFDGTDRGIRLKSSRERGGIVEEIRVNNIVMKDIKGEAIIFNLMYDKHLKEAPVSEKTPIFRNIHISNITGTNIKNAGCIRGITEMPIENLSFNHINLETEKGFEINTAKNISFHDVTIDTQEGPSLSAINSEGLVFENIKSNNPHPNTPIISLKNIENTFMYNCFQLAKTDVYLKTTTEINSWSNNFINVTTPIKKVKIE